MKRQPLTLLNRILNWPSGFSLLEILIILTGIGIGAFLYWQTSQISNAANKALAFDKSTRELLISINLANLRFNDLINGNSDADLEKDVFARLDAAASLCENIDRGGPDGLFVPAAADSGKTGQNSVALCNQIQALRSFIQQRWQDHQNRKMDIQKTAYEASLKQFLQDLQRFEGLADSYIEAAETKTRQNNLELSIGLTGIFFVIAIIIWRTRKMRTQQTEQLEREIEKHSRLNIELDSERNLTNTLIDNLPDAVFAKDNRDKFLIANMAAANLMGVSHKGDLIGKTEADFQPRDVAERIQTENNHILETGEILFNHEENLIDLPTGNSCWRQTTKVPLRDRSGIITGLVGISRDITTQKETEQALRKANEKLTAGIVALEQDTHETELLSEMVDLLQACPNTEEACVVIADQMNKLFPSDSGILYLFHASRNLLDQVAAWGAALPDAALFKPDDCWGLRRGRIHIVTEKANPFSVSEKNNVLLCSHITPNGPADYLCVPLVAQGEALGLMHLRHRVEVIPGDMINGKEDWYNHNKRQRIHTIVDSLSLALANLKLRSTLRQQSIRDPLTGMFNRRYMEETLEREILRATRSKEPIGVIMLDIDHFKLFNDTNGHQGGDALLTALGLFFLSHVRGEDVACRYGGEEFILLLPGSTVEQTCQRAEELREKVRYVDVTFQRQTLGMVTLSLGVSVFPKHGSTPELLIQAADQALYRAKLEGRNKVVVA